jgi:hypothetical protein
MVLTSWSSKVVQWHQSMQDLSALCKPHGTKRRHHKARTTLKPYLKSDVPRLVKYFDPAIVYTDDQWTRNLTLFNTIVANQASSVTPLTTDDTPIVLDSGCSVAISNDLLNFSRMGSHPHHLMLVSVVSGPSSSLLWDTVSSVGH